MALFQRTPYPILGPRPDLPWASRAVFNPGACYEGRRVHLVFQATAGSEPNSYTSALGYATSSDGVHFTWREVPFWVPNKTFASYGLEAPRITFLDGRYWITYTVRLEAENDRRIGLASTVDFEHVEEHGIIGPPIADHNAVLFPRRIGGKIALLHHIEPDIQVVYFDDWKQLLQDAARVWAEYLADIDEHVVLRPARLWERKTIGVGPPPIETAEGWLLLYYGVDDTCTQRIGAALLDLEDPQRTIARVRVPLLEPELPFEREGAHPNTVLPGGAVILGQQLHLYYSAAHKVIGHAVAPLEDVIDFILEEQRRSWSMPRVYMLSRGHATRTITQPVAVAVERLHGGRPVLEPVPQHSWESRVVLNPAAVLVEAGEELEQLMQAWELNAAQRERLRQAGGACVMIYRAQGTGGTPAGHAPSSLGLAVLTPMLELVHRWPDPIIRPDAAFQDLGAEDARCTKVGDTYYLFYTGYTSENPRFPSFLGRVHICLATTKDFLHWELHGPISGDVNTVDNKNAVLLPEPVDGKWLLLHRPLYGRHPMAIHLAEADRPEGPFRSRGLLMASYRYREFALSWIGAGGPPIALGEQRFLMIYHQGHLDWEGHREYDLAAALLDFNQRDPVVARLEPLMRPKGDQEKVGDPLLGVDNVLFACANYRWGSDLIIPYAAADSRIFGARVPFEALLEALTTTACTTQPQG